MRALKAALLGLALAAPAGLAAAGETAVRFAVLQPSLSTAYLELAKARGVFQRHGIDLQIRYFFGGGNEGNAAIISGQIDAGSYGPPALIGIVRGLPIRVVAAPPQPIGVGSWLVARKGIPTVEDLRGKVVASAAAGMSPYQHLLTILKAHGLTIHDVRHYVANGSTGLQVLQSGQADAAILGELDADWAKQQGFGHPLDNSGKYLGVFQSSSIFASLAFIQGKPDVLRALIAALLEARVYARDHFEEYYGFARARYGKKYDAGVLRAYLKRNLGEWKFDGAVNKKAVRRYYDDMVEWGDLKREEVDRLQDADIYDLRFLPKRGH
jgi:ABC-type nitrate/sulfonate/bicarbonate transport system substrate-binding protein